MTRNTKRQSKVWILVHKDEDLRNIDALYLLRFADDHSKKSIYLTKKEARNGQLRGDAYEDPNETKIVGFKIELIKERNRQ